MNPQARVSDGGILGRSLRGSNAPGDEYLPSPIALYELPAYRKEE